MPTSVWMMLTMCVSDPLVESQLIPLCFGSLHGSVALTLHHCGPPVAVYKSYHALHSVTGRPDDAPVHVPYAPAPTAAAVKVKSAAADADAGSSRSAVAISSRSASRPAAAPAETRRISF